ncbi:Hemolysin-3 [Thiomonas sp. X19]|uniref:PAQR family membrane homeostasis protein TrhA n=1 Tax=Thiomonas sp. X19 TaxID=1050370 RepID=UPI000B679BDD|nr:hemolysin III family protein [Thiomonas sp. X19]SCC95059.1 Hemolysin-3 [Thiomonas sp. X19]
MAQNHSIPAVSRAQTLGEEIANSLSHGLGLALAIAALPILVVHSTEQGSAATLAGDITFGSSAILLYLVSTLYHALPHQRVKSVLQVVDHVAIYLFIAGTYTPFTLGVLHGTWGWTLFGLIWALALAGLFFKIMGGTRYPRLSTFLYLAMGWVVLIAIRPLWLHMPTPGLALLLAGGVSYTLGVVFFVLDDKVPYTHFVWHLFVLAGTVFHFFAVLLYAA